MTRSLLPLGPLVLLVGLVSAAQQDAPPDLPVKRLRPVARPAVPLPGGAAAEAAPAPAASDEDALRAAGLFPPDGPKLVAYLQQRTVSDADQDKIRDLIGRFKADKFDDRQAAAAEVERFGPAAVGPLKAATEDPDPEVEYRARQVLARLETIPHGAVAAAAVRAVVGLKPPGAAGALLGFLPLADGDRLAEDIRAALVSLAAPGGKPDLALVAALADPSPVRRAAAYVALVEGGPEKDRVRIPESYERVKAAVRADADPEAKFRGLWALALTTREKEYVPDLIALTPALSWGRLGQVEDLLLQLAGKHPPGGRFRPAAADRAKARDAWAGWWAKDGPGVDLAKLAYQPRVQGFTDLVEQDPNGFGAGRLTCLGPDGKERWQVPGGLTITDPGVVRPTDARVLPSGRLLTVEGFSLICERDSDGRLVRQFGNLSQPQGVQPLPGGGLLVVCRSLIVEYGKDGKETRRYTRPGTGNDIAAGRRLADGTTLFVTTAQQGHNCYRLDADGKDAKVVGTVGRVPAQTVFWALDAAGPDRVVIGEQTQVAEYDLATGKLGWKFPILKPTSVQRLANGNTLIAAYDAGRVVEVDPDGEVVWEHKPKDRLHAARAYRR